MSTREDLVAALEMERIDLLIVGAGWHGLAMAKTYLEGSGNGEPKIAIMDYAQSLGGTWAKERLYPGLKTNNVIGSYEFSDYPMLPGRYGLKAGQHIPGDIVHRYLCDFAEHYDLSSTLRFETRVDAALLQHDETWLIQYSGKSSGQLVTSKLVIATGLTSEPYLPKLPGRYTFQGHVFHSKDLKIRAPDLASSSKVVVIGGNKSAMDVCYSAVKSGAQVSLVIRASGGGPSWVWPSTNIKSEDHIASMFQRIQHFLQRWPLATLQFPRLKPLSKLSLTRFYTLFDPNPFGEVWKTARFLLHRTIFGQFLCAAFWALLGAVVENINAYNTCDELEKLRPWTSTFWMGNSLSVHNYETDWFQLVREGRIVVYHAEVVCLAESTVRLSNGVCLEADTLVSCTGWKAFPSIKFSQASGNPDSINVGFDQSHGCVSTEKLQPRAEEAALIASTRQQILHQHPVLRTTPIKTIRGVHTASPANIVELHEPYRLYRFLVPSSAQSLQSRNLAFIGLHVSIHAILLAQVQALWITAFFQHKLPALHPDTVRRETYLHTEYERLRRPREAGGSGARFPDLVFDSLPYVDMLMADLGLPALRKGSFWEELLQPYSLGDYEGLVAEWLERTENGTRDTAYSRD